MSNASVDEDKLEAFLGQILADLGGAASAVLVRIGERLGLYRAMACAGPLTPAELAERTGTAERYIREWLCNQAAGGYVTYDPASGTFELPAEQAAVLADDEGALFMQGMFDVLESLHVDEARIIEAFRSGDGVGWHEHHHTLFAATGRSFRPLYAANLVQSWLPALSGVVDKLHAGARVADVGCGTGASTILMAQAFPASTFAGFDYHEGSITEARKAAADAGVADRVTFDVAAAKSYPGTDWDLVCFFDCLHDLGDPAGAAAHVRRSLAPDGTWLIVEPNAGDHIEDNLNPIGRVGYALSTLLCTPASLSQEVGLALGGQAGEARLREVVTAGGFSRFRRAAETPFNLILEARP